MSVFGAFLDRLADVQKNYRGFNGDVKTRVTVNNGNIYIDSIDVECQMKGQSFMRLESRLAESQLKSLANLDESEAVYHLVAPGAKDLSSQEHIYLTLMHHFSCALLNGD